MAYTLVTIVRAKSNDPALLQKLKTTFIEASAEFLKDEGCLGWQPLQSIDDTQEFRVVARFTSQAKYYEIHYINPYRKSTLHPSFDLLLEGGHESVKPQRYMELETGHASAGS